MGEESTARLFVLTDDIRQRLASVETLLKENREYRKNIEKDISNLKISLADQGRRVGCLEQTKAGATSIKEFIAWGVAIAAMIWGIMK